MLRTCNNCNVNGCSRAKNAVAGCSNHKNIVATVPVRLAISNVNLEKKYHLGYSARQQGFKKASLKK